MHDHVEIRKETCGAVATWNFKIVTQLLFYPFKNLEIGLNYKGKLGHKFHPPNFYYYNISFIF